MQGDIRFTASGECLIMVPELTLSNTISLINKMWILPEANVFIFDFTTVRNFTPLSLIYLSSEISYFRKARFKARFSVTNYKHATYAAHMGFFRTFGAQFGNEPGQAAGSASYIPITIQNTTRIKTGADEYMIPSGEYIDKYIANKMAKVLIPEETSYSTEVLAFCLREIIRNIVEHSESKHYVYCAQYWPTRNKVSLAIIDRGIGVRESLQTNPHLKISTDNDALRLALQPEISSKMYKGIKKRHYDVWQNSGYGLHMTSEICKLGGSFFIASGESAIEFKGEEETHYDISLTGTLINLEINTLNLDKLAKLTMDISLRAKAKGHNNPSKASLGIINNDAKTTL